MSRDNHRPGFFSRWFHEEPSHGLISTIMWLGMLVVLVLMAARMVPASMASGRMIPELVSFVPFAVLPTLAVVVLAFLFHRRFLTVVSAVCLVILVSWHIGYFLPRHPLSPEATQATSISTGTSPNTQDNVVRVMTVNTLHGGASAAQIVATVREQKVEVLALQEVTPSMLNDLKNAGIYQVLPHYVFGASGQWDNGGTNVLFSVVQMDDQNTNLLPIETSSMPAGDLTLGGKAVRFVSAHPNSPHKGGQGLWSEGLGTIQSLAGYDHSYVIMGDFNATWDHARFRELLGDTFVDAGEQAGEGFHMSYPANSKIPPMIEIDHIVYTKGSGIRVGNLQNVEIAGTDHKALLATLEVTA